MPSYAAEPDFQIEYQIRFEESKQKWHAHSIYNRRTKHASYFNNEIAAANSYGSAPQSTTANLRFSTSKPKIQPVPNKKTSCYQSDENPLHILL